MNLCIERTAGIPFIVDSVRCVDGDLADRGIEGEAGIVLVLPYCCDDLDEEVALAPGRFIVVGERDPRLFVNALSFQVTSNIPRQNRE